MTNFQNPRIRRLIKKISNKSSPLSDYTLLIFQGIASGKDQVFYIKEDEIQKYKLERRMVHPLLKGRDLKAYMIHWSGTYVIYPYDSSSTVIPEDKLKSHYPNTYNYFLSVKKLFHKMSSIGAVTFGEFGVIPPRQI